MVLSRVAWGSRDGLPLGRGRQICSFYHAQGQGKGRQEPPPRKEL